MLHACMHARTQRHAALNNVWFGVQWDTGLYTTVPPTGSALQYWIFGFHTKQGISWPHE